MFGQGPVVDADLDPWLNDESWLNVGESPITTNSPRHVQNVTKDHLLDDEQVAATIRDQIVDGGKLDESTDAHSKVAAVLQLFQQCHWPKLTGVELVLLRDKRKRETLLRGQRAADGVLMEEKDELRQIADGSPKDEVAVQQLARLLKFIGFADGIHDRTSKVLALAFADKSAEILHQGRKIMTLFDIDPRTNEHENDSTTMAISVVRRLLRHNALNLVAKHVRLTKRLRRMGEHGGPARVREFTICEDVHVGRQRKGKAINFAHLKAMLVPDAYKWSLLPTQCHTCGHMRRLSSTGCPQCQGRTCGDDVCTWCWPKCVPCYAPEKFSMKAVRNGIHTTPMGPMCDPCFKASDFSSPKTRSNVRLEFLMLCELQRLALQVDEWYNFSDPTTWDCGILPGLNFRPDHMYVFNGERLMTKAGGCNLDRNEITHVIILEVLERGVELHSRLSHMPDAEREQMIRSALTSIPVDFVYVVVAAYDHAGSHADDRFFRKNKGGNYEIHENRRIAWQQRIFQTLACLEHARREHKGTTQWVAAKVP